MATRTGCRLDERRIWAGLAAIALVVIAVSFLPLRASIADPPPPPPERDVTIEFIRVVPPRSSSEPGAVRFSELSFAAQDAMRNQTDPKVDRYKVVRRRTIHLGDPQSVRIAPGDRLEFRRVGNSVECADSLDGLSMSSFASPAEMSTGSSICTFYRANHAFYVVAWVQGASAPSGRTYSHARKFPVPVKMRAGESIPVDNPDGSGAYKVTCIRDSAAEEGVIIVSNFNQAYDKLYKGGAHVGASTIYLCKQPESADASVNK